MPTLTQGLDYAEAAFKVVAAIVCTIFVAGFFLALFLTVVRR